MPDDDDQRPLRAAIQKALEDSDLSQREFGIEVAHHEGAPAPYTQQTVAGWFAGRAQLNPRRVFAMEKALRLRPGTLSKLDGYVPVDTTPPVTPEEAVAADPTISSSQRPMIEAVILQARRQTQADRDARRKRAPG